MRLADWQYWLFVFDCQDCPKRKPEQEKRASARCCGVRARGQSLGNIGKIVSRFKSQLGNRNNLRLFFDKNMTILPIAEKASSNQALTIPNHWQFTPFLLPNPFQNHYQYCPYLTICKTMPYTEGSLKQKGIANHENHYRPFDHQSLISLRS